MDSFFEALAIIFGALLVVVFAAGAFLAMILMTALVCATIVVTAPFWLLVALFRPQLFKGLAHAAMR